MEKPAYDPRNKRLAEAPTEMKEATSEEVERIQVVLDALRKKNTTGKSAEASDPEKINLDQAA